MPVGPNLKDSRSRGFGSADEHHQRAFVVCYCAILSTSDVYSVFCCGAELALVPRCNSRNCDVTTGKTFELQGARQLEALCKIFR